MMKKIIENLKKFFPCLLTSTILIGLILASGNLLERKTSVRKYRDFFQAKQNYQILFVGTSHVINGIFPMELWNDYGYTSYNFGNDAATIPTSYWMIMNALDYTTPELIVIDCFGVSGNTKITTSSFDYMHSAMDAFPLSLTKVKAVIDLMNDPNREQMIKDGRLADEQKGTAYQLLWNFAIYHSRWNDLKWYDFSVNYTPEQGGESRIRVAVPNKPEEETWDVVDTEAVGFKYLDKIVDECNSRGIEVLLTYLPFPAMSSSYKEANSVAEYAAHKDIEFIDFLRIDIVNYDTDLYDSASHLNPSGARRVTNYLGSYISNNFNLADLRNNLEYSVDWNEKYSKYYAFKIQNLKDQSRLDNYLMLLNDKDFALEIQGMVDSISMYCDGRYTELLDNIEALDNRDGGVLYSNLDELKMSDSRQDEPDLRILVTNKEKSELIDRVSVFGDEIIHE